MNAFARPWIGLVFKLLAVIAAIFAFIFFMNMQNEQSLVDRYRSEGTVSRAIITDKSLDTLVYEGRKGRTRSQDIQVLNIRFDPKSRVKYADYIKNPDTAALPSAPPVTGDPAKDMEFGEVIWVSRAVYDKIKVGDALTVVDTIYSGDGPELVADIRDFDGAQAYPKIGIALALALLLAVMGWRISRASARRGLALIANTPGTLP